MFPVFHCRIFTLNSKLFFDFLCTLIYMCICMFYFSPHFSPSQTNRSEYFSSRVETKCYGAEADRQMGIQGEDGTVLSAREIVAWYNGLPGQTSTSHFDAIEQQLLKANKISIVGQGNVAIDIARILLSPIDMLRTTDITSRALAILADSRIDCIELIGRRGPLQAAFTIKELREMLNLPNVQTQWNASDFNGIDGNIIASLPRPKKRITELMWKNATATTASASAVLPKQFIPYFFRSPAQVRRHPTNGKLQMQLIKNHVNEADIAIATNESETIVTDVILRSIGYKSINVTDAADNLSFDERRGAVRNINGRVQRPDGSGNEQGLYVSGWLGTGPTGVILTTMNNSFSVAKNICDDIQGGHIDGSHKPGLEVLKFPSTFSWSDWLKIDSFEREVGNVNNKPREKILTVARMLELWK